MIERRRCPRCGGELYLESDIYGLYVSCIQCGYILTPAQERALLRGGRKIRDRAASRAKVA
jgi:ribosomal protein S27AE